MLDEYLARCSRTLPASFEEFRSEDAFWSWVDRSHGRAAPFILLADLRGRQLSSEELAGELARLRDRGVQQVVLAIGPADGWAPKSLERADRRFSFGPMTFPHELAAVIAAEQIYRATTIWSGHPYHGGH